MLSNEEPCESSDKPYSAEDEEDGTDPICNQQRERKRRKQKKNKTKTMAELEGVKTQKRIAPIRTAAGRKAMLKSAKKKVWF